LVKNRAANSAGLSKLPQKKAITNMSTAIRITNCSSNPLPAYATAGASGLDLRAHLSSGVTLMPMERVVVPTGLFLEIPHGWEAQVRPRSGLAMQKGITCLNSPGTIDSDYRGEVKVILINLGTEAQQLQPGDRIAQLVFQCVERVHWHEVEQLDSTIRGSAGFGSTGLG
jgi:dUTP pyrophosphatase